MEEQGGTCVQQAGQPPRIRRRETGEEPAGTQPALLVPAVSLTSSGRSE